MKPAKRRPGRLWLFFCGRKRRGFPGLLAGIVVALVVLAALFRLPGAAEIMRYLTLVAAAVVAALILASLVLVVVASLRPPRRR